MLSDAFLTLVVQRSRNCRLLVQSGSRVRNGATVHDAWEDCGVRISYQQNMEQGHVAIMDHSIGTA